MENAEQRGGAFLRVHSLIKMYESCGFEVQHIYRGSIRFKKTLGTYLKRFQYGRNTSGLFSMANVQLPIGDILHLDNLRYFNWNLKPDFKNIIYNAHNLEFENYFGRSSSLVKSRFMNYEFDCIEKTAMTLLCSEREKQIVLSYRPHLKDKLFVVPNVVDASKYFIAENKNIISFVGTLDYYPNILAINYLCHDFMPKISNELRTQFKFVVAGRNPLPGQKEMIEKAGFEFRTNLSESEMLQLISGTKINLVPITTGSGTRLKIIEGVLSGCECLSTELGAEGIESRLITRAELKAFPQKCQELALKPSFINSEELKDFFHLYDWQSWLQYHGQEFTSSLKKLARQGS